MEKNMDKEDEIPVEQTVSDIETTCLSSGEVEAKNADNTLIFVDNHKDEFEGLELTPEEERHLWRGRYGILFSLIMLINTVLFIDKATMSYASILGLFESTNIDTSQYDDLNSIFYVGYTIGQALNFLLQKVSLSKFMTIILFLWSVIVFLHCAAYNFVGLIFLRLFLGFTESVIVPAMEVTLFQFFTPKERATLQPIFWISCVGTPIVIAGFIAYGVLHITNSISPWKIFMIITGGLTIITTAISAYLYPSDPSKARFLTDKEKYFLIKRVQKQSSSSISQNVVKRYQVIEALKDPISWLFALFAFLLMLANNLNYQQNLLYVSLGVSNLGSTLVSVAGACFSTLYMIAGSLIIYYWPNHSAFAIAFANVPSIASGIAMVLIPWSNKLALLAMLVLGANTYGLAYIVGLGWTTSSASGNTKRYVRNFMFMIAYGISNIVSPQIWKGNQSERYYAAWAIQIVLAWFGSTVVGYIIFFILKARNRKRLELIKLNTDATGNIVKYKENGEKTIERVEIANLDLTDHENKNFIYPL